MDLRPFQLTGAQIEVAKTMLGYQPFIISDNVQTGIAYAFLYGEGKPMMMEKDKVSRADWEKFADANARMRKMYNDWIDATCAAAGDPSGLSVVDTACNTGYFLYRFWEKGLRTCVGHDRSDQTPIIAFLNQITGGKVRFIYEPYNPLTHRIKGCPRYDIVVSSAIMCHLSDPLNNLAFLASITRKVLLLHTRVSDTPGYVVSYGKPNKYYAADPFPVCFDNDVTLSRQLLFEGLQMAGFKEIRELEYSKDWLPYDWYSSQKTLICVKAEKTASGAMVWNTPVQQANQKRNFMRMLVGRPLNTATRFAASRPRFTSFARRIGLGKLNARLNRFIKS